MLTENHKWRDAVNNKILRFLHRPRDEAHAVDHRDSRLPDPTEPRPCLREAEQDTTHLSLDTLPEVSDQAPCSDALDSNADRPTHGRVIRRWRLRAVQVGATSSVVLLGALASGTPYFETADAQPQAEFSQPAGETQAGEPAIALALAPLSEIRLPLAPSSKAVHRQALRDSLRDIRKASGPAPKHRQYGPTLLLPDPKSRKRIIRRSQFDPLIKQQQQDLLDLGFDLGQASADGLKGPRTRQALEEFRALYLTDTEHTVLDTDLAFLIGVYADLARQDAEQFNIDRGVVAAIRLSSVRTGVEFSYLMELAAVESAFNPVAEAPGSSAAGLYQFTHDTWLNSIKSHGDKYGLGSYAAQVEYTVDRRGNRRPRIANQAVYRHVLALRKNPRVSAIMAAESVRENLSRLSSRFEQTPSRTELYLTHFLGPAGAVSFIKALNEQPDSFASEMFPTAARNNKSIFHAKSSSPRTVNEVYQVFSRKFDTARYEDWSVN